MKRYFQVSGCPGRFMLSLLVAAVLCGVGEASDRLRVLVLTDIGNEPDDAQSMVRFLLYSNEWDVEGLIATTSTWQRRIVSPELIKVRVEAYREVRENLLLHAKGYPEPARLLASIKSGRPEYGMSGVGEGKDTEASDWIIRAADRPDSRPLWIPVWGGAVDLAQALWRIKRTRTPEQVEAFVQKLRVYAISDQDDTGPWIRRNFPQLVYIVSVHAFSRYNLSTWCGISGDRHYNFRGPDFWPVSNDWLDQNVRRGHGPLGALYPRTEYIMEGDTPSFLYLVPNGLGVPERPEYGSWGGRYERAEEGAGLYTDTVDTVRGVDGVEYTTNQATIWRWREAYQNDFAARMDWSVAKSFKEANHNPAAVVNGKDGKGLVELSVKSGEAVALSAAGSTDPDGNRLDYEWFHYREASTFRGDVGLRNSRVRDIRFTAPVVRSPQTIHLILTVRDDGEPSLSAYRRIILTVEPAQAN